MLKATLNFRYLLVTTVLLTSIQLHAQSTLKTFYPTFQKFKVESKEIKNEGLAPYFDVSACVSGDCINGEGVWLEVFFEDRFDYRKKSDNYIVTAYYTLYKGSFKENGSVFEGKSITNPLSYTRGYDTKKLEPHYKEVNLDEVVQNMDNTEADFTGICESYQKNGKTYFQRLEGFHKLTPRQKSYFLMESEFVWYQDGVEQMAEVTFRDLDTVAHRKIRGVRNRDESFIAGKIVYKDGGEYVGFIYNNKREGTGVFNDQLNPLKKGVWIDDEFTYQMEVSIPSYLHEPRTTFAANESSFEYDGRTYKGLSLVDPKTNITFFKSLDDNLFYHGFQSDGIPDYLGCYINLQSGPDERFATYIGTPQSFLIGIFEEGILVDGIDIKQNYHVSLFDGPDYDHFGSTYIRKGRFVNGKQEGCGYLEYITAGRSRYEEGEFKAGKVVGWHLERYYDKGSYTNRSGIRHSLIQPPYYDADYEKLKDLEASECIIDQMGGDVKTFVANMKVDGNYKRRENMIASYKPIKVSSIDYRDEQVNISDIVGGQEVYLPESRQALYFNSYDSVTKILTLQGNVRDSDRRRNVFITQKVPITEKVCLMRQIVKEDNVSTCFYCAGFGKLYGRRYELVRKKGLAGNDLTGYRGYRDAVTGEAYHLVHEKVNYVEKCYYCGGDGKNVFKASTSCYELLQIVE